jgi:hypothetical protein
VPNHLDGVGKQEDVQFFAVPLGERVREPQSVVGAFGSAGGVVEDDECLHVAVILSRGDRGGIRDQPGKTCGEHRFDLQVFK